MPEVRVCIILICPGPDNTGFQLGTWNLEPGTPKQGANVAVSVAVVGATGAVGELMRQGAGRAELPRGNRSSSSPPSAAPVNRSSSPGNATPSSRLRPEAFAGVEIVLSSTPSKISREFSPIAAKPGAIVVDNSSAWRMDPDVPLVVPEVNADELQQHPEGHRRQPELRGDPDVRGPQAAARPRARCSASSSRTYQASSGKGGDGPAGLRAAARVVDAGRAGDAARPTRAAGRQRAHARLDARPERLHRGREQGRQRDEEDPGRRDDRASRRRASACRCGSATARR